jgi:hypothetical protein
MTCEACVEMLDAVKNATQPPPIGPGQAMLILCRQCGAGYVIDLDGSARPADVEQMMILNCALRTEKRILKARKAGLN